MFNKIKSLMLIVLFSLTITSMVSCDQGKKESNSPDTESTPILNELVISNYTSNSITVEKPTYQFIGNPQPSLKVYIGLSNMITINNTQVDNYIEGPVDISTESYTFENLDSDVEYTIIAIANNTNGSSIKKITQGTMPLANIAPELKNLSILEHSPTSITLTKPTFNTTGNPQPTVIAYIGYLDKITATGSTVSNYLQGPIDVSSANYKFNNIVNDKDYKIIVIAQNTEGTSTKDITAKTYADYSLFIKPVTISDVTSSSITVVNPEFYGIPAGTSNLKVEAYIGIDGTIEIDEFSAKNSLYGPIDITSTGHTFNGLSDKTNYKIIFIATGFNNIKTYSVTQTNQKTCTRILMSDFPDYTLLHIISEGDILYLCGKNNTTGNQVILEYSKSSNTFSEILIKDNASYTAEKMISTTNYIYVRVNNSNIYRMNKVTKAVNFVTDFFYSQWTADDNYVYFQKYYHEPGLKRIDGDGNTDSIIFVKEGEDYSIDEAINVNSRIYIFEENQNEIRSLSIDGNEDLSLANLSLPNGTVLESIDDSQYFSDINSILFHGKFNSNYGIFKVSLSDNSLELLTDLVYYSGDEYTFNNNQLYYYGRNPINLSDGLILQENIGSDPVNVLKEDIYQTDGYIDTVCTDNDYVYILINNSSTSPTSSKLYKLTR